MHPNPAFRKETNDQNLAFAAARGFGMLSVNGDQGPLLSHVPFLLNDKVVELHLVRSNPIARLGGGMAALSIVGPHSYISPDWYGIDDQVPTWNYVAVHLRGELVAVDQTELHGMLDRLSAKFEAELDKVPWTSAKMDQAALERMMRMISPFRMQIKTVEGTWKLNQNKDVSARLSAAEMVATSGIGDGLKELANLMRSVDEGTLTP